MSSRRDIASWCKCKAHGSPSLIVTRRNSSPIFSKPGNPTSRRPLSASTARRSFLRESCFPSSRQQRASRESCPWKGLPVGTFLQISCDILGRAAIYRNHGQAQGGVPVFHPQTVRLRDWSCLGWAFAHPVRSRTTAPANRLCRALRQVGSYDPHARRPEGARGI